MNKPEMFVSNVYQHE